MNLFSEETRRDPYPVYAKLRQSSPALLDRETGLWMILDYDGVKRATTDYAAFSSRSGLDWLVFSDPPRHTKLRSLIMRAFTPTSVALLESRIRDLSRRLLNEVIERGEMDLAAEYSTPLPMIVIAQMLGIPDVDRPRYLRWSEAILNMSYTIPGGAGAAEAMTDFRATTGEMNDYLANLTKERRASPKDDLLTRLVQAEVEGEKLTQGEILGFFQLLLVGGQETTTNLINNAILCLLENPEQLSLLRGSTDLIPAAIEETLRFRSPVQWMFRLTTRDVVMNGVTIPAGRLALVMMGAANRDPKQFSDPDRFVITREPNQHLAFGHGIHFCLGAALSRLEGRIALHDLLNRLNGLEVANSEPWLPRRALHVHGPTSLPVRFEPGRQQ